MLRRLLRTLTIALLCGLVVFVILFVSAWVNLRGERGFCSNQNFSRHQMRNLGMVISDYQKEHGSLPLKLTDLPQENHIWNTPDEIPADGWERPFQYQPQETSYELFSFGRDGKQGGIGLDADLYLDDRNRELSLPTFSQYLQEDDDSEVKRNMFLIVGAEAGISVALYIFILLWMVGKTIEQDSEKPEGQMTPRQLIVFSWVIVLISSAVGFVLLPVHISGH